MKAFLVGAIFTLLPTCCLAAEGIFGSVYLAASDVATFDTSTFSPGPAVDVYHVSLCNCLSTAIGSLEARFVGDFVNNESVLGLTFKETPDLPMLGPNIIADTYFVTNEDLSSLLALQPVDDGSTLYAAYTFAGAAEVVPVNEERVIAVLTVLAGSPALTSANVDLLRTAVGGVFGPDPVFGAGPFTCIPEPTTCVLAGLALVGPAARRRV
jgi:hypothetical protein